MLIKGTLEYVSSHGLERRVSVNAEGKLYRFSFMDSEYMDEDQPEKFPLSQEVSYPLQLIYVNGYEPVEASEKSGLTPHGPQFLDAVAIGEVRARRDPRTYLMDVGGNGDLPIHFNRPVDLAVGSRIKVDGELAADQFGEEVSKGAEGDA